MSAFHPTEPVGLRPAMAGRGRGAVLRLHPAGAGPALLYFSDNRCSTVAELSSVILARRLAIRGRPRRAQAMARSVGRMSVSLDSL